MIEAGFEQGLNKAQRIAIEPVDIVAALEYAESWVVAAGTTRKGRDFPVVDARGAFPVLTGTAAIDSAESETFRQGTLGAS